MADRPRIVLLAFDGFPLHCFGPSITPNLWHLGISTLEALGGALVANQIAARIGVGPTITGSIALGGPAALLTDSAGCDDRVMVS